MIDYDEAYPVYSYLRELEDDSFSKFYTLVEVHPGTIAKWEQTELHYRQMQKELKELYEQEKLNLP